MRFKYIAKKFIPKYLLKYYEKFCVWKITISNYKKSRTDIFEEIYNNAVWGSKPGQKFCSGTGSHLPQITEPYLKSVSTWLRKYNPHLSGVDLGCGDFNLGSRLRNFIGEFAACDISKSVIDENIKRYKDLDIDFFCLDIVKDELPNGDIAFLRQVLQHLSNTEIKIILKKIGQKYKYLVITEHIPLGDYAPNIEKSTGSHIRLTLNSGVNVEATPFSLKYIEREVLCEVVHERSLIKTIAYRLK